MSETATEVAGSLVPVEKLQAMVMLEAGYLWLDMGQHANAKDVFAGAAALMPKSEVPQLALGTLELVLGKPEKALQAYRAAQRLSPKSSLPRAHCGEALLFMGKVSEAMKELKAALELDPESDGAKLAQALLDAKEEGAMPPPKKEKAKK